MYRRFNYMRLLPAAALLCGLLSVSSCKTNENNYRQAYETAVAKNREASGVDSTIYARIRNSTARRTSLSARIRCRCGPNMWVTLKTVAPHARC